VRVETVDMRKMPFPDGAFDVAVSNAAIHNLYVREDRSKAIREIARVLKPGGVALISDIRHLGEYGATFADCGCAVTSRVGSRLVSLLLAAITFGSLNPGTILVKKAA
jgi:arsenite methyltransferase